MKQGIVNLKQVLSGEAPVISIFTTAGFPKLNDTVDICIALDKAKAGLIEIGIPFSDPIADGETIQRSSDIALANGMTLEKIFEQVVEIRKSAAIPLVLMGYYNPILQYGVEKFLSRCSETGVNGLIIPDLPREEYLRNWQTRLNELSISQIFLITGQTEEARIREIDEMSTSFIYAVSSTGVTGGSLDSVKQEEYYRYLQSLNLKNPVLIGFGIRDRESFELASRYVKGVIIGSEFIRRLEKGGDKVAMIEGFMRELKG